MDGVQLSQGYSHFEEAVYFLPFSSQSPGTHFIDLGRIKGSVDLGATQKNNLHNLISLPTH